MFFTIPENSSNSNTVQVKSFKGQPPPRHYISLFGRLCASIRSRKSRDRSSWTFPRRDSGENLSREFHGSRHDWHDVPTVILRRETLMVATPSRRAITCPGSIHPSTGFGRVVQRVCFIEFSAAPYTVWLPGRLSSRRYYFSFSYQRRLGRPAKWKENKKNIAGWPAGSAVLLLALSFFLTSLNASRKRVPVAYWAPRKLRSS